MFQSVQHIKFTTLSMKIYYSLTVLLFLPFFLKAQINNHAHKICKHQLTEQDLFHQPQPKNTLLSDYDVTFYKLDISAERDTTYISGYVQINATSLVNYLDTFAVELITVLNVDSIFIDGQKITSFVHANDEIIVPLTSAISGGNPFTAIIYYHGTPQSSGFFSGISTATSTQWNRDVTWTLSEPFNAKQWWPCKQDLNDKADSVYVFITTSNDNMAGSNGLLTDSIPLPNNKVRYEWKSTYPIAYYLISIAISQYVDYSYYVQPNNYADSILVQNYVYNHPNCLNYYKNDINATGGMIVLFSDLFGLYPFHKEKYGHCLTEIGGGMEHQTMTTIGSFNFTLVAHELGHMWFGDNVTCATWQDIWINEGFASYSEYLAYQYLKSQTDADNWMNSAHNYIMSQPGGSVYVPAQNATDVWRIFDGRLSYNKGAAIIHTIRYLINNDSIFFSAMQDFQTIFKDSTATGMDFKYLIESHSGMNFTDYFNQWYFGEGYPIYDITWQQYTDTLFITSAQSTSSSTTTLFETDVDFKLNYTGGDTLVRLHQYSNLEYFKIPFDKIVTSLDIDPNNWLINDVNSITVSNADPAPESYLRIFPNPANEFLQIHVNLEGNKQMYIQDIAGRMLKITENNQKSILLDINDLAPGIYMLIIHTGQEIISKKFQKL